MIDKISDLPENVLGFTARETVIAKDYGSVIIPAVEKLFSGQGKVQCLYHLGEDFTKFEAGAMWGDAKLGFKHLTG